MTEKYDNKEVQFVVLNVQRCENGVFGPQKEYLNVDVDRWQMKLINITESISDNQFSFIL